MHERPSLRLAIRRGFRRSCPRCGEGALFRRGIAVVEFCSVCHLRYQPNNGDTWMFMLITDRVPMLFGIAALYFGFVAVATPMLATIRQRQGVALALDYVFREYVQ